ncbi:MAG TPA: lysozyme [Candidatus Obscuribacterales bacterium]
MSKTSQRGLELIMEFEGLELEAYQDSVGVWTIGYGHTRGVRPGDRITEEQARAFLKVDVMDAEKAINRLVEVDLNQNQFDALVAWTYNLGSGNLANSTLLKKINEGKFDEAQEEFDRWVYAGGRQLRGLVRRRDAEEALWGRPFNWYDSLKLEE